MAIENEDLASERADWKAPGQTSVEQGYEHPASGLESKDILKEYPVPTYRPSDQFTVAELKQEYPEWESHYGGDAALTAISYERTRALRKIGQETGVGGNILLETGGEGLKWAIDSTPKEVGMSYDAHGIGGKIDPIMELDLLLEKGIKKDKRFYSMNFIHAAEAGEGFGADRPFTKGGLVLVAEHGKKLVDTGIKYVVVGEEYNRVMGVLQNRYPEVTFIPWNEAPAMLTAKASVAEGRSIPCEEFTEENRPYYHIPKKFEYQENMNNNPEQQPSASAEVSGDDVW